MNKLGKLSFKVFESNRLSDNQMRNVLGGCNATTWTDNTGGSGTDQAFPGKDGTSFSDGTKGTDPNTSQFS